jgi:hypothetical protein
VGSGRWEKRERCPRGIACRDLPGSGEKEDCRTKVDGVGGGESCLTEGLVRETNRPARRAERGSFSRRSRFEVRQVAKASAAERRLDGISGGRPRPAYFGRDGAHSKGEQLSSGSEESRRRGLQ